MSGKGSDISKAKTVEEMEKNMAMKMMWLNPSEARLLMDTSSHTGLNIPNFSEGGPENSKHTQKPPGAEIILEKLLSEEEYKDVQQSTVSDIRKEHSKTVIPEELANQEKDMEDKPIEELYRKDDANNSGSGRPTEDNPRNSSSTELILVYENSDEGKDVDDNFDQKSENKSKDSTKSKPVAKNGDKNHDSAHNVKKSWSNSKEVFKLPNVQLFSISPSSAKSVAAGELRIVEIQGGIPEDATKESLNQTTPPPAFLQVGDWLYPLIPYNSPVYRSEEGHYIFPDLKADKAGAATGLVIPANTYQTDIDKFERILKKFTALDEFTSAPPMMFGNTSKLVDLARREEDILVDEAVSEIIQNEASKSKQTIFASRQESTKIKDIEPIKTNNNSKPTENTNRPDIFNCGGNNRRYGDFSFGGNHRDEQRVNHSAHYLSTKIADGIVAGAEVITRGMTYGACKTSEILEQSTGLLKSYSEGPTTTPKRIHRKLHCGVKAAKDCSGKFVELSNYVVDELGNATAALAEYLSPYLHQTTTTLVTKAAGTSSEESNYIVSNVLEVTTGTFQGMHMIYSGLHEAARILAKSITNNTVDVITHYYGPKAGEIIDDAAETIGNIALGGANAQSMTPKSVVKRAVKDTGVALLTKENN